MLATETPRTDAYTDDELKNLYHNDHEASFKAYLSGSRHTVDKHGFLYRWIAPNSTDYVLECGPSGGKTSIDLSRRSGCRCLGIDFDEEAVHIASRMRDAHFPELQSRCRFALGDLTSMDFDRDLTKILMPDFTEHVPDRVLVSILNNIRNQFDNIELFVYTPLRSHLFEILKHRNILLKNRSGHINVKTREQLVQMLDDAGWSITSLKWRCSSMYYVKPFEYAFGPAPVNGKYFRRRIAIKAKPIP
jgi:hypothetical protein